MGADITGPLNCSSAQLIGTDIEGAALIADWIKVSGGVHLDSGFTAAGTVTLSSAHVSAGIDVIPTALAGENEVAFSAPRAHIVGTLRWAPAAKVSGQVNLEGATVGQLE